MPTISLQNPLDQPNGENHLLSSIENELRSGRYNSFKIVVAFAKAAPLNALAAAIQEWRAAGKQIEAVIGVDLHGTSFEALKFASDHFDKTYVIHGSKTLKGATFHPKIFLFEGSSNTKAYIGSNNLTSGGLIRNAESYTAIDMTPSEDVDLLKQFNKIWEDTTSPRVSRVLDSELLQQLRDSGVTPEEKSFSKLRLSERVAIAEITLHNTEQPDFPKLNSSPSATSRRPSRTETIGRAWQDYGQHLAEIGKSNLYWKVANKNNHLDQQLWAINWLTSNHSNFATAESLSNGLRSAAEQHYPDRTMEGTRAVFLSKVVGFLESTWPVKVSEAYKQLQLPMETSNQIHNQRIITQQFEKYFFWNNIFGTTNRHQGRGGRTQAPELFRLFPVFFIYQLIFLLREKGQPVYGLTKFEIETFAIEARTHNDLEAVADRIISFREAEDQETLATYLKGKSKDIDSRFYNILDNIHYFTFSSELIAIKPEFIEEIHQKVISFETLLKTGKLIIFESSDSAKYRDLLFSSQDLLAYHR